MKTALQDIFFRDATKARALSEGVANSRSWCFSNKTSEDTITEVLLKNKLGTATAGIAAAPRGTSLSLPDSLLVIALDQEGDSA